MAWNIPKWLRASEKHEDKTVQQEAPPSDAPEGEDPEITVQADRPISKIEEDRFDRAPFAKQVAHVIARRSDPSSLVVGIYGPWGDGKTSTLAMIKETLAARPDVIVIDYNPWFYGSDADAITRSFFGSIGEALEKSGFFSLENVGALLARFGRAVPTFGENVAAAGEAMTTKSLSKAKDEVGAILERHGKRVVVFIDDIDRLDRRDIQTLFKLVRLSGDFSHTTYVLSFDDGVVAEALGEAYGAGDSVAGRSFLEKIIQVPLHLPPASPEILRKMVFAGCDRVLRENGIELNQSQAHELGSALAGLLALEQRTPRQAKLYDNAVSFALPILKGEVNVVDQMVIEAIRIFYPALYKAIRENRAAFLDQPDRNRRHNEDPSVVTDALTATGLPEKEQTRLKRVLERLFPRIGSMGYGGEWDAIWAADKHIRAKDYFSRYFTYCVPTGDISDLTVDRVVELAGREHSDELTAALDEAVAKEAFELLVTKLRRREEHVPVEAIPSLAKGLASRADKIKITNEMMVGDWSFTQAAILIAHMIKRLPPDKQEQIAADVLAANVSAPFATEILSWSRSYEKEGEQRGFLPDDAHERLMTATWTRLTNDAAQSSLFEVGGEKLNRILFYFFRLGSDGLKAQVSSYLGNMLTADPANAMRFIRMVTGLSWEVESGIPRVSDFGRDQYDSLKVLVDMDALHAQLLTQFADSIEADHYVHDYEDRNVDVDLRLARQFAYLHSQPMTGGTSTTSNPSDGVVDETETEQPEDRDV